MKYTNFFTSTEQTIDTKTKRVRILNVCGYSLVTSHTLSISLYLSITHLVTKKSGKFKMENISSKEKKISNCKPDKE